MAAKKKGAPTLVDVLSTSPYPHDAAGLERMRGLGVTPGVDAFLALGFPHVIVPTEVPIATFASRAAFKKAHDELDSVMPRAAVTLEHAILAPDPDTTWPADSEPLPTPRALSLEAAVSEALAFYTGRTILELEVMHGTGPVAEAVVEQIAALPVDDFEESLGRGSATISAGLRWILLRVPRDDRDRMHRILRDKLETLGAMRGSAPGRALDAMLHGRAGLERSLAGLGRKPHLGDLVSVEDDVQWACDTAIGILEKMKPQDREHFDPQLVVLCGPDLLAAVRANVNKLAVPSRKRAVELLALFH